MKILFIIYLNFMFLSCATQAPVKTAAPTTNSETYIYTTDYFTANIPLWQKTLVDFKDRKNLRYLELGVYEGRSLFWVLQNILTDPNSKAVAVDIFPTELYTTFRHNLKISGEEKRVEILKGRFNDVLPSLPRESFDLIYLDGGHMSWTTLETAMLAWPLLKQGGLLIFDDYEWHKSNWPPQNTPRPAVDAFLSTHKNFIEITHKSYQVMIKKIRTACSVRGTYACTPLGKMAYYWQRRGLYHTEKNTEILLNEKTASKLEAILNSPDYKNAADATELARLATFDKKLNLLLTEIEKN